MGQFTRTLSRPKPVNGEAVEAHYERGILTIELPLAAHEQPRAVSIRQRGGKEVKRVAASTENSDPRYPVRTNNR